MRSATASRDRRRHTKRRRSRERAGRAFDSAPRAQARFRWRSDFLVASRGVFLRRAHGVELAAQLANLSALSGDLFAEESRCEEDTADDEADLDHGPHRVNADAENGEPRESDEARDGADRKNSR